MKLFGTLNNPSFVLPYSAEKSISSTTTDFVQSWELVVINIAYTLQKKNLEE